MAENVARNQLENTARSDSDSQVSEDVAKVVGIEMILIKIFRSMKTRDLLQNSRLVSRKWRDLSTNVLLKRKKFRMEIRGSYGKFVVGGKYDFPKKLGELADFLTTSKRFPCAHFIFNENMKSPDAQAFLSQFGSRIKGVKLIGPQNLGCIRNLLVDQIPHLEILELSGLVQENRPPGLSVLGSAQALKQLYRIFPEDSPGPAPQLLSLTCLKLGEGNSPPLVKEILDAAPNLQACFGIRSKEEIDYLSPRIHIVKGLKLLSRALLGCAVVIDWYNWMQIVQQLHLTSLELGYSGPQFPRNPAADAALYRLISTILNASQSSLKKLKLTSDPDLKSLIGWPQLGKVEKLTLSGKLTKEFPRLFAQAEAQVGVSRMLPNLHTIHLKEAQWIQDGQIPIFQNHPQISTVKSLKISQPKAQDLELFVPLFPNVTHLSLAQVQNFTNFAPTIWQMQGLKSLQIEFNCEGSEIDAGFTGMEKTTCEFLGTAEGGEYEVGQVEEFRVWPSILEATELEQLFLPRGFSEEEEYNDKLVLRRQELPKATSVSFKYAFKLMPKLRVFSHRDQ